MAIVTIIGSGMMGSALAFPARENGHEVRLVGTIWTATSSPSAAKPTVIPSLSKIFPKA